MSNFESALRIALSKGDIGDAVFRRKVYEAAANAMHRSLDSKPDTPQYEIESQNRRLAIAIRKIEAELKAGTFVAKSSVPPQSTGSPTAPPVRPSAPPVEPAATKQDLRSDLGLRSDVSAEAQSIPLVQGDAEGKKSRIYVEPKVEPAPAATTEPVEEKPGKKPRRRFAKLLTTAVVVSLIGVGALWALNTGIFQSAEERDTSVPNPPVVLESEDFEVRDPGTANAPATLQARTAVSDEWVTVFSPSNPTGLELIGGATATVESDPFGDYARIVTPSSNAEIQIGIPLNVLNSGIGNMLQVSLRARSDEGRPTQISVTCDLGVLGDCGRRRFDVGQAEGEFIFQIDLADAQQPPSTGLLKIITDVQNSGRAIKLLEARIRVADGS